MTAQASGKGWLTKADGADILVQLVDDWVARSGSVAAPDDPERIVVPSETKSVRFDSSKLGHWDSALIVFLSRLRTVCADSGIAFDQTGLPVAARHLLSLLPEGPVPPPHEMRVEGFVEHIGTIVLNGWANLLDALGFVGEVILRVMAGFRGRLVMRGSDVLACMEEAGIDALPIVTIVNILVGGILAFVGEIQLHRFGADIYVANLVGVAVIREMGPLMTAIVMAGRTGGAYAAQIATMEGNEEIDALRTIGIPVFDYLILPRVAALTLMMPVLYLYGSALGIIGGYGVAVSMLNVTSVDFISHLRSAVHMNQILFGLMKSVTFGALIAGIGCRAGLNAGRSAADVGHAATGAVVRGIVGVIMLDAVFAICANALRL